MASPAQNTPESSPESDSPTPAVPASITPVKGALAKNNAFGPHAPSWNLGFPDGNLTAVEIVVYCPHWLKCIDVITRFVNNGVKSVYLAAIINEYRDLPGDAGTKMVPNSTTVMMQYAMRRSGYEDWTIGTHKLWDHPEDWNHADLYVGMFRPPCITHPKKPTAAQAERNSSWSCNQIVAPIPFKNLAIHVKKHPTGFDSLDLTRCVKYALAHPDEDWRFPDDFKQLLVKKLGGPKPITASHQDHEAFARLAGLNLQTPKQSVRGIRGPPRDTNSTTAGATKRSHSEYEEGQAEQSPSARAAQNTMRRTRAKAPVRQASGTRRSARNVNKAIVYDEEKDNFTSHSDGSPAPAKKRKLSRLRPSIPDDGDYQSEAIDTSDDEMPANDNYEVADLATPETARMLALTKGTRTAPIKAPYFGQPAFTQNPSASSTPSKQAMDPKLKELVRGFEGLPPSYIKPPTLSANRRKIDDINIHLYGDANSTSKEQLWATAMSSLAGPRRHPPFRPLADLTDPEPWDDSDWAENIRWAKQQKEKYGSTTWTEYDYHQEQIKQHRLAAPWVSEELISIHSKTSKYKVPRGYIAPATLPAPTHWAHDEAFVKMHEDDLRNELFVTNNADTINMEQDFAEPGGLQQMDNAYGQANAFAPPGAFQQTTGYVQSNNAQHREYLQPAMPYKQISTAEYPGYLQEPFSFPPLPLAYQHQSRGMQQPRALGHPMALKHPEGLLPSASSQHMGDLSMMAGGLQMVPENDGPFSGMGGADFWPC